MTKLPLPLHSTLLHSHSILFVAIRQYLAPMSRFVSRAIPLAPRSALRPNKPFRCSRPLLRRRILLPVSSFHADGGRVGAPRRSYGSLKGRASKRRQAVKPLKERELFLDVKICIEEDLPDDQEILRVAETLRVDVPMAMKVAFENLSDWRYKTRDTSIGGRGGFEKVELSVMLCNDDFIQKLNKEWRDEDRATDVLSMSQHIPELDIPILMMGDVVISVETAARQAEERGHTLLDEIRILMVHGLLHLLGFDHEISDEAEAEMENEEERVLKSLGWTGKGLIKSAYDGVTEGSIQTEISDDEFLKDGKKQGNLRFHKPKFSFIFCDLDGTLLNSKSQITPRNAKALKEAISREVTVVIATGKTCSGAISALQMVDLAGRMGLVVYGRQGRQICRRNLDQTVCREAFLYSLEHNIPLVAFSQDRCLTLYDHPVIYSLHTVYHEPKAEVMPSIEHLIASVDIQKLLFYDTMEGINTTLRPYWSEAIKKRAGIVQTQPDMLEIVSPGTSKGNGVVMLLDHLGITTRRLWLLGMVKMMLRCCS